MEKEILEVCLKGNCADTPGGVLHLGCAKSYGIYRLHITADEAWQGLAIAATFDCGSANAVTAIPDADGFVDVPAEATAIATTFRPGVVTFSGTDGAAVRRVSAKLLYRVQPTGCISGGNAVPPAPTVTEQLQAQVGAVTDAEETRKQAEAAREEAENARATAENSRAAAESSRKSAESARATAESARAAAETKRQTDTQAAIRETEAAAEAANNAAKRAEDALENQEQLEQTLANAQAAAAASAAQAQQYAESINPVRFATSTQGALADSAVQSVNGQRGTAITLTPAIIGAATAAQGALAESAVQPEEVPTVDSTLTQPGQAADAAEVGNKINELKGDITETTKNLFNKYTIKSGALLADGSISNVTNIWHSELIDIDGKDFSVQSIRPSDSNFRIGWYNDDETFNHRDLLGLDKSGLYFANTDGYKYIRVSVHYGVEDSMQIEIGQKQTDYVNHITAVDTVAREKLRANNDIVELLDVTNTRNMYDKNSGNYAYGIGSANLDVQSNPKNLAIILDVDPSTTYTVSGIRSGWNIAYEFPIPKSQIVIGSQATSKLFEGLSYISAERGYKTITTSTTAKSILLLYWRDGTDTYTEEDKRNALQIEKGNTYTDYVPFGVTSERLSSIEQSVIDSSKKSLVENYRFYVKNVPLFARHSNGFYAEHPTWASRQYDLTALCVNGRYLYTGSHLGFKKWDIGIESDPIDVTKNLESNEYLQKNDYIDQWSINPWGTGGGERIPYKMEYYNGHIYAIARGGSGFVADDAAERNPNTNVKGETETEGTVGYFIIFDDDLNVLFRQAYYGTNKTEIGYRKPSGFVIDKGNNRIYISCQLYGWLCYDISSPSAPVLLNSYSPLYESDVSSINGADLSSKCGPIEYQNGCVFENGGRTHYAVAGYVDGIHVWDVTDISAPTEIRNDMITDTYGLFWAFRMHESTWDTTAHVFDAHVVGNKMYATIAPTTNHGNDENRVSGLVVIDITDLSTPTYKYYPIASDDLNYYQRIGDVKPSHLLVTNDKVLLNNGNKGIAVYDNSNAEPIYIGCIPSDGDEIYQIIKTDDGRLVSGCHIAPYNFRINRGIN